LLTKTTRLPTAISICFGLTPADVIVMVGPAGGVPVGTGLGFVEPPPEELDDPPHPDRLIISTNGHRRLLACTPGSFGTDLHKAWQEPCREAGSSKSLVRLGERPGVALRLA
jgi:hypothetical protein